MRAIILPLAADQIAKIAAGQVVQTPSCLIKELLENALDAGAKNIEIKIRQAGLGCLEITDDGCGISLEELPLAVQRHATSKISQVGDLLADNFASYGFRGEALASIGAVSHLTILSRTADQALTGYIRVEGGQLVKIASDEEQLMQTGSTMRVERLFFNVPARQKFLAGVDALARQLWQNFIQQALVSFNIGFRYWQDDNLLAHWPAVANPLERVAQIWGNQLAESLLPLRASCEQGQVEGWISSPSRKLWYRPRIMFYVNDRFIKHSIFQQALLKSYGSLLPAGQFPAAFIFWRIPTDQVDVNICPSKLEVGLAQQSALVKLLQQAVQQAIKPMVTAPVIPQDSFNVSNSVANDLKSFNFVPLAKTDLGFTESSAANFIPKWSVNKFASIQSSPKELLASLDINNVEPVDLPPTQLNLTLPTAQSAEISNSVVQQVYPQAIYQLFSTYILATLDDKLLIIDQHAAAERILYHKMQANYASILSNRLVVPELLRLEVGMAQALSEHADLLERFGLLVSLVDKQTLAITASPVGLDTEQSRKLVLELTQQLALNKNIDTDALQRQLTEHLHSHLACKTAIRAGDWLSPTAMQELLKQLWATPDYHVCIHGRPTVQEFSQNSIAKWFKRPG